MGRVDDALHATRRRRRGTHPAGRWRGAAACESSGECLQGANSDRHAGIQIVLRALSNRRKR
jgi:hypothetical protein